MNDTAAQDDRPVILRVQKFWQMDRTTLLWLLRPLTHRQRLPGKVYLRLCATPGEEPLQFLAEKPQFTMQQQAFSELLRKYADAAAVGAINETMGGANLVVTLHKAPSEIPDYLLVYHRAQPAELELIETNGGISHIRVSSKGVFTKKHAIDPGKLREFLEAPRSLLEDLLRQVVESPEVSQETESDTQSESESTPAARSVMQRDLLSKLRRRLRTFRKSQTNLERQAITEAAITEADQAARLLQTYAHLVKEGDFVLELASELTGKTAPVTISLDPEISVGENINEYFAQAKKLRRGISHYQKQKKQLSESLIEAEEWIGRLENQAYEESQLVDLQKKFGLAKSEPSRPPGAEARRGEVSAHPYKVYLYKGIRILVGKGPHDNDAMTKQARSHDFWLHAAGASGAHVIVDGQPYKNRDLEPDVFRVAAILALHFSKRRQDLSGEVYFTKRDKISKKKGMAPGLWNVEHARSIFVRYSADELKPVLDLMQ